MDRNRLAVTQGAYFLSTGVWPLLHLPSFERVTGPKQDEWLVRTVGCMVAAMGWAFWKAGRRRSVGRELAGLAATSAAALAAIDTWYVARRRISPVYLLDAVLELGLVAAWVKAAAPWPDDRRPVESGMASHWRRLGSGRSRRPSKRGLDLGSDAI